MPEYVPFSILPLMNPITITLTNRLQLLCGTFENLKTQTVLESILGAGRKGSVLGYTKWQPRKQLQSVILLATVSVSNFNINMHYNDIVSSRAFETFPLELLPRAASRYLPPSTPPAISFEHVQGLNPSKRQTTEVSIERSTHRQIMLGYL